MITKSLLPFGCVCSLAVFSVFTLIPVHEAIAQRGGFSGGGARANIGGGGGGISRPSMGGGAARPSGGGGAARPSFGGGGGGSRPSISNMPSMNARPSQPISRPNFGGSNPSLSGIGRPSKPSQSLPSIGNNRPSTGINRPSTLYPSTRPSVRPPGNLSPTTRPSFPDRPSIGGGNRPTFPDRPSIGGGNRPTFPDRPSIGGGTRPTLPDLPSIGGGNRPTFPDRPSIGGENRPTLPDRPSIGGINRPNRPDWPSIGGGNINIGGDTNININNRPNWGWNTGWGGGWSNQWHNHDWYHGSWNGHWGNNWYRPPATFFVGWGLGAWSGLGSYNNPYYVPVATSSFNYSQPIVISNYVTSSETTTIDQAPVESSDNEAAMTMFNDGLAEFKNARYSQALAKFDLAITKLPGDPVLHEMRALTYFALGKFQQSAAVLNSLLATAPGMDWTTMSSLYGNLDDYTKQLRALEQHVKSKPTDAAATFVLAYHYLVIGHTDEAIEALQTVLSLKPNDSTANRLLSSLVPPEADIAVARKTNDGPEKVGTDAKENAEVPQVDLVGNWLADASGLKVQLMIDDEFQFTWKASPEGKDAIELNGDLMATSNMLILETETQGAMVGNVRPVSSDEFQFIIAGGPPQDAGLAFVRQN